MASNLLFYQLLLVALVLICLLIHVGWPDDPTSCAQNAPRSPITPRRQRSKEPKPFTGLIHKPLCEACEQEADARPKAPGSPPPVITFTRGRRRTVDTHAHFCPDPRLFLPRLARPRQHPRQWPSRRPALAPAAVCLLPRIFL